MYYFFGFFYQHFFPINNWWVESLLLPHYEKCSSVQYSTVMKLVRNGRSFNVDRGNFEKKAKKKTICEIKQDSLSFNAPLTSLPSNAFLQWLVSSIWRTIRCDQCWTLNQPESRSYSISSTMHLLYRNGIWLLATLQSRFQLRWNVMLIQK